MVAGLLRLAELEWPVPGYCTLCRRQKALPACMVLVKQIDDHIGQHFAWVEDRGRNPACEEPRRQMLTALMARLLSRKNRVSLPDAGTGALKRDKDSSGILTGKWS